MSERCLKIAKELWTGLALVLSACGPSIRGQSGPGAEVRAEPSPVAQTASAEEVRPAVEPAVETVTAAPELAQPAPVVSSDSQQTSSQSETPPPPSEPPAPVAAQAPPTSEAASPNGAVTAELWKLERDEGGVPLMIPRDETLTFEVRLNLGLFGNPAVGKVTMSSLVRPFYSEVAGGQMGEQAQLTGRAEGSYKVYTLDNTISSALLPQAWPRTVHRNKQLGSESRARENLIGVVDGKQVSRYRGDGHCKGCKEQAHFVSGRWPWSDDEHCKKCKRPDHRVWREAKTREVPAGSLDMLTAVYLARSLVIDGRERVEFPLIDRNDLWQVQLSLGGKRQIETKAGTFNAVAVELRTGPPEGTDPGQATKFEGLFGIHGTISIWMDVLSGVPVQIQGAVPAGPVDLDVTIDLIKARGAPPGFATLR